MRLEVQIESLEKKLKEELKEFASGQRFHSVRKLMHNYSCNRRVVDGALERLVETGVLDRRPNVGFFRNGDAEPTVCRILFVAPDWPSDILEQWGRQLAGIAERRGGYRVRKYFFAQGEDRLDRLPLADVDVLVISRTMAFRVAELAWLAALPIPVILLGSETGDFMISSVDCQNDQGAILAAQYLIDHGHRRLLIVISEPHSSSVMTRRRAFQAVAETQGCEVEVLDCSTRSGESSNQRAYEALCDHLAQTPPRFTAIFAVSDGTVPGLIKALSEYDLRIPEHISIIGFGGSQQGEFFQPPLTSVDFNIPAQAEAVFDGIAAHSNPLEPCFKIYVPTQIIERSSVKTIRKD